MTSQEFRNLVDRLAKEWIEAGEYDAYDSILEFLDESFDRDFYLSLDPDHIIHEEMRNQLGTFGSDKMSCARDVVMSGIMECYDFSRQTKGMTDDEMDDFVPFGD